jgi:hypothetical protein
VVKAMWWSCAWESPFFTVLFVSVGIDVIALFVEIEP